MKFISGFLHCPSLCYPILHCFQVTGYIFAFQVGEADKFGIVRVLLLISRHWSNVLLLISRFEFNVSTKTLNSNLEIKTKTSDQCLETKRKSLKIPNRTAL